jgi:DNA-binding transcriptional LysR family regulator
MSGYGMCGGYPTVSARLTLIDRHVQLIEEGIDVALRIGELDASSMIAMRVGEVGRLVVAAPRYLKQHPRIEQPADLAKRQIISMVYFTSIHSRRGPAPPWR